MSECPQCGWEYTDMSRLENGEWGVEYIPDETDFICLEWDSERCSVYYHEPDADPGKSKT